MSDDMVLLPRSVVAALVDPKKHGFAGVKPGNWVDLICHYCGMYIKFEHEHSPKCPVRIVQQALAAASK